MKLIFALGNPGEQYAATRHNVGFMVLDRLAREHGAEWRQASKFKAVTTELLLESEKVLLAKPTTYYNEVGQSYQAIAGYYGIDLGDTLVVHDDLDLPFGTIRTRTGGSGGGSNGIRSLNAHGGNDTRRLRIGIANDLSTQINNADFVLSRFSKSEAEALPDIITQAEQLATQFASSNLPPTTFRNGGEQG